MLKRMLQITATLLGIAFLTACGSESTGDAEVNVLQLKTQEIQRAQQQLDEAQEKMQHRFQTAETLASPPATVAP